MLVNKAEALAVTNVCFLSAQRSAERWSLSLRGITQASTRLVIPKAVMCDSCPLGFLWHSWGRSWPSLVASAGLNGAQHCSPPR